MLAGSRGSPFEDRRFARSCIILPTSAVHTARMPSGVADAVRASTRPQRFEATPLVRTMQLGS